MTRAAPKLEHGIQNDIRNALCDEGMFFRANVGTAWTSNDIVKLADGSLLLRNPRPFSSGLPAGFHDLFGAVEVTITPAMVGSKVAVFASIECKSSKGKVRAKQEQFAATLASMGGRTGFARDVPGALRIARGEAAA
jgi:hypothetical protein